MQTRLQVCRKEFEEKFHSAFDEANKHETFVNLSLPSREIQRIDAEVDSFIQEYIRPGNIVEDLNRIEVQLVDIAMEEQD